MLSIAKTSSKNHARTTATFVSLYSTFSGLVRRNWRTGSHPAPQQLTIVDPDDPFPMTSDAHSGFTVRPKKLPTKASQQNKPTAPEFLIHRARMKENFPEGWNPPRKISREAMEGIRHMHALNPELFTTASLAQRFKISPEAVRRILKSKWGPTREESIRYAEKERKAREMAHSRWREEERQLAFNTASSSESMAKPSSLDRRSAEKTTAPQANWISVAKTSTKDKPQPLVTTLPPKPSPKRTDRASNGGPPPTQDRRIGDKISLQREIGGFSWKPPSNSKERISVGKTSSFHDFVRNTSPKRDHRGSVETTSANKKERDFFRRADSNKKARLSRSAT